MSTSTPWCRNICGPKRRARCRSLKRLPSWKGYAGENEDMRQAVKVLTEFNREGALDNVPFESVWTMINAVAKSAG